MSKGLFESGLTDFLNVLQSERALYLSEDQLVQSEQRLALSLVALYKALCPLQLGKLIPLNSVAEMHEGVCPLSINHTGQLPSVTLSF